MMPLLKSFPCLCLLSALGLASQTVHKDRTVVILSLDGVAEYMLEDPQVPMPTLMRMIREGAKAEYMLPINPTITWPNHTSIVTGVRADKHLLLFNAKMSFPTPNGAPAFDPKVPKAELVHFPTLYDVAHEAGLVTGQVDWPAADGASTIDFHFGECPDLNGTSAKEVIAAGLADKQFVKGCLGGPQAWRNRLWSDAAIQMIEKHHPNLMLIHLLTADSIHHMYGTKGFASSYAMAFNDDRLRDLLDGIERAGLKNSTTVFVVSDHGHRNVSKAVHPEVVLRNAGILTGEGKDAQSPVWIVPDSGVAMLFIRDAATRSATLAKIAPLFQSTEGVSQILTGEDLVKAGFPTHAQSAQGAPDMVLGAAPGYDFEGGYKQGLITPSRQKSTHGFINSDPQMHAIFIAWGAAIKPGIKLPPIENIDVAPTAAKILGLKLNGVDGHSLDSILR